MLSAMRRNGDNPNTSTRRRNRHHLLALIPCLGIIGLAAIHLWSADNDLRNINDAIRNARLIQKAHDLNPASFSDSDQAPAPVTALRHDRQKQNIVQLNHQLQSIQQASEREFYYAIGWIAAGFVGLGSIIGFVILSDRAARRAGEAKTRADALIEELSSTERRLERAMHAANQGLWELNLADGSTYYNDTWYTMLGYEPGELPMHTSSWESLCHPDDLPVAAAKLRDYLQDRAPSYKHELRIRMKNGEWKWVHDIGEIAERGHDGTPLRIIGVQIDIDEPKAHELKLIESETRYKLAVKGSRDGLWDWDLVNDSVYYAPQWKQMLGLAVEDEVSDRPDEWISRIDYEDVDKFMHKFNEHLANNEDVFEVETRMIHKTGKQVWMLCRGTVIRDNRGRAVRVAGSLADITDIKRAQEQLEHLADHDRLTGLPNRELFHKQLQKTIDKAKDNPDDHFAVLFFDFDRFKLINDSLGHGIGDALLVDIADVFVKQLRRTDVASRFGGDEFVLLLRNLEDRSQAEAAAERLLALFAQPHDLHGHEVYSTASIGLVKNEPHYTNAEEMLRDADAAMYQAKETGRGRYVLFDNTMYERNLERIQLERDLHDAVNQQQISLIYQPIIDLETGAVDGFEALARWDHPILGKLPPERFIPLAEDTGLIVPIGEFILRSACQQAVKWSHAPGIRNIPRINVNLSLRQLAQPDAVRMIQTIIRDTGIHPERLRLEITESTIIDKRYNMIPRLQALRQLGIKLVMDDFGTGHSSLNNLHQLPIDVLKIDHGFVRSIAAKRELAAVMQTIIMLAKNLDMTTVAEGIEDADQLVALQALGCELAQGYYFNPPLSPQDATNYLLGQDPQPATG